MKKVLVNGGHGGKDSGAVGNGLLEKNLTHELATKVSERLVKEYNVKVKNYPSDNSYRTLKSITDTANKFKADLLVSIHINAGGGTGFESFIYNSAVSNKTKNAQKDIHNEIIKATRNYAVVDRGTKYKNLHVLRESKMSSVLTENMFIDTVSDARLLKEQAFINRLVEGHVLGIAKTLKLKKKKTSNKGNDGTHYRVVTGSFKDKENADKRIKELNKKGFESFIDVYKK